MELIERICSNLDAHMQSGIDFEKSKKELLEVIDTLGRATTLISREMQKKNAAFTQLASKDVNGLLQSLKD